VTGLLATHSANDLITDSAASATAMSTGVKTNNGMVGVDVSGVSRRTILEAARDAGLATGLVTSTRITDATPACFAAHITKRNREDEIALQLIQSKVNVLFGAGPYFYPAKDTRSKRHDDLDPIAVAKQSGYTLVKSKTELQSVAGDYVIGLFEHILADKWAAEIISDSNTPTLAELTSKATELLRRNPRGFFLVVEEEGVDRGGHINREEYVIHYLKQLDDAVKVGLEFAFRDQHTLVMVTSDHETGAMNLVAGSYKTGELKLAWDTDGHTGQSVPLFAFGPHAWRFTGLKDNTELPKIMAELLGLEAFQN